VAGTYRVIEPAANGNNTKVNTSVVSMDSSGNPQVTDSSGGTVTLTAAATPCSFTSSNSAGIVVSPAGVVMISNLKGDGNLYPTIAFPDQTVALTDLTGTWNRIAWQRADPGGLTQPYQLSYGSVTLASGVITGVMECSVAADLSGGCNPQTLSAGSGFAVNPAGGFTGTGDLSGSVAYAYKTASGIFGVSVDPDGSINFITPQATQALPTVGATNSSWNLQANTAGMLAQAVTNAFPGISTTDITITGVTGDTTTNTVTRDTSQDGATAVSQTLHYNIPLAGFRKRDGVAGTVSPAIFLPVPGMGFSLVSRLGAATPVLSPPSNGFFNYSVNQP
jgi:hypothetical protein